MLPGAFDVIEGDPRSPVVLHVPHASTWIPAEVRARILLDDAALEAELAAMTDAATDLVAAAAAGMSSVRPWTFVNRASRLVVDPERFTASGQEPMESVGMGAVYLATSQRLPLRVDDAEHRADLLARFFDPYAGALAELVDERLVACGRAVVLDVHSYPAQALPYEIHVGAQRPAVCLGTDVDHTPAWLVRAAAEAFGSWGTAVDSPFEGTYVPLKHYRSDARVVSLMVEVRRDQYVAGDGAVTGEAVARLGAALAGLVDAASSPEVVTGDG